MSAAPTSDKKLVSADELKELLEIVPDFEKFRDWNTWEEMFVHNLARNLGEYKETLMLTAKQWDVIRKLEHKCYRS